MSCAGERGLGGWVNRSARKRSYIFERWLFIARTLIAKPCLRGVKMHEISQTLIGSSVLTVTMLVKCFMQTKMLWLTVMEGRGCRM